MSIGNAKYEMMDLYKDGMMCAVKIGASSSKLCYVIDQSISSLKLLKKEKKSDMQSPEITKVVLWLILETKSHIEDENGIPQLSKLRMLMFKNRLNEWKREVRNRGLEPEIFINYRN